MKKLIASFLFSSTVLFSVAQSGIEEMTEFPPNAEPGKCYAKCRVPAEYETKTERVMTKPEGKKLVTIPAKYETQPFKVLVKEEQIVKRVIPATFKTLTERVLVDEGSSKVKVVPETYETVSEKVLVSPARTEWVKGKADKNCLSADPSDCNVWCLKEIPATYKTVFKRTLKTPAKYEEVTSEPVYKTVSKRVVDTPERIVEEVLPAVYKTEYRKVLVTPARAEEKIIPAEFSTVTKRVMTKSESVGEWREILCNTKLTSSKIAQIQKALIAQGYSVGNHGVDNIFGNDTKVALTQFQKDNNLPVGNLNVETLKALNIAY